MSIPVNALDVLPSFSLTNPLFQTPSPRLYLFSQPQILLFPFPSWLAPQATTCSPSHHLLPYALLSKSSSPTTTMASHPLCYMSNAAGFMGGVPLPLTSKNEENSSLLGGPKTQGKTISFLDFF